MAALKRMVWAAEVGLAVAIFVEVPRDQPVALEEENEREAVWLGTWHVARRAAFSSGELEGANPPARCRISKGAASEFSASLSRSA